MNNVRLWLPTDQEIMGAMAKHEWLDHSVASSIHQCPKYAMLRYIHGMTMEGRGRQMSLEAGSALHRAFAMHRLWWMFNNKGVGRDGKLNTLGERLFGSEHEEGCWPDLRTKMAEPVEQACLHALYTSGFYDEDRDKVRTLSNLEEALLHYLTQYEIDYNPIVDIEVALPFGVEWDTGERLIYLGRADAIEQDGEDIRVVDNKTSTQVGVRGWEEQWHTNHQPTGYMIGASVKYERPVNKGRILALQPRLPVKSSGNSFKDITTSRNDLQIAGFFQWLLDAWRVVQRFKDRPFEATMYTSHCFQYFSPCQYIPVCTADEQPTDWTGFEHQPWHPTHGDL